VLCLQETKTSDFPMLDLQALGYEAATHGLGRWNGVAVLSRVGIADVARGFAGEPGFPDPEARRISATCGGLRVWSVYVPNGRSPDDEHYTYKLAWLAALRSALATELTATPTWWSTGDFNIAPTDADVWDPHVFRNSTHVTPAERAALAELRGPRAGRRRADTPMKGRTRSRNWDYRAGMFHQDKGNAHRLVYATPPVAERSTGPSSTERRARAKARPTTPRSCSTSIDHRHPLR
jgi:exodeoxyribonuclease-3